MCKTKSLVRAENQVLTELTKSLVCAKIREQNKGVAGGGRVHIYLCVLSQEPGLKLCWALLMMLEEPPLPLPPPSPAAAVVPQ